MSGFARSSVQWKKNKKESEARRSPQHWKAIHLHFGLHPNYDHPILLLATNEESKTGEAVKVINKRHKFSPLPI